MSTFRALSLLSLALSLGYTTSPPAQEGIDGDLLTWAVGGDEAYYRELAGGLVGVAPPPMLGWAPLSLVLWDVGPPGGVGDDATLRSQVARFLSEDDPGRLFLLAQHLRVQTTRRWGTLWTIDSEPIDKLRQCLADDPNATRRAFAVIALRDVHGFQSMPYLADDSELVRVAAARCLTRPVGVSEEDAGPLVANLITLMGDELPAIRKAAALALPAWVFLESHRDVLEAVADSDPELSVRAAALEGLARMPCLRTRARLCDILGDPDADPALREAARRGLAHSGILPAGL